MSHGLICLLAVLSGQDLGAAAWPLLAASSRGAATLSIACGVVIVRRAANPDVVACRLQLGGGAAQMGPVEARALADALGGGGLCGLTGLEMEGGALGTVGVLHLAVALHSLTSLTSLSVRCA